MAAGLLEQFLERFIRRARPRILESFLPPLRGWAALLYTNDESGLGDGQSSDAGQPLAGFNLLRWLHFP